jgi:hypothetical protein
MYRTYLASRRLHRDQKIGHLFRSHSSFQKLLHQYCHRQIREINETNKMNPEISHKGEQTIGELETDIGTLNPLASVVQRLCK